MAECRPPAAKKGKRNAPVCRITAKERAIQFKEDMYANDGVLFCKFCEHNVDFICVDTIKDHLKSKKHCSRKEAKRLQAHSSRQVTLSTVVKAKDHREEFVLDYIKMCTLADIPLEKTEKVRPSLRKHCLQAGALPQAKQLRSTYVPRLFDTHFTALKEILREKTLSITADETTDVRDHSILNVIATLKGRPYLVGVVKMDGCNHSTFSQAIIKSVTDVAIEFDNVMAIVSDSAAYCKKAYTVEPPKKSHFGTRAFGPCREVGLCRDCMLQYIV